MKRSNGWFLGGLGILFLSQAAMAETSGVSQMSTLSDQVTSVGFQAAIQGGYSPYRSAYGTDAGTMGARLGVLINHVFSAGVGLDGLVSSRSAAGFLGAWTEVDPFSHWIVHPSVALLVGGAYLVVDRYQEGGLLSNRFGVGLRREDYRFFVQPELRVSVNLNRYLRIAIVGTYRSVAGSENVPVTNAELSTPQGALQLTFGLL